MTSPREPRLWLVLVLAGASFGCESNAGEGARDAGTPSSDRPDSGPAVPDAGPVAPDSGVPDEPRDYDSRADSDLEGRDVNDNRIRDDVEVWLEATFRGDVRERMRLHAQLYQEALTTSDESELAELMQRIEDNGYCLWSLLDLEKPQTTRELFARTFNTRARYDAFQQRERRARTDQVARPLLPEAEFASRCDAR